MELKIRRELIVGFFIVGVALLLEICTELPDEVVHLVAMHSLFFLIIGFLPSKWYEKHNRGKRRIKNFLFRKKE